MREGGGDPAEVPAPGGTRSATARPQEGSARLGPSRAESQGASDKAAGVGRAGLCPPGPENAVGRRLGSAQGMSVAEPS